MYKTYIRNRTFLLIVITTISIFTGISVSNNFADSIEQNETSNIGINSPEYQVLDISISQGSSASDIASLLSSEGVISSQLAFELYLRTENLTDKLRAGDYEIPNNLEFSQIT